MRRWPRSRLTFRSVDVGAVTGQRLRRCCPVRRQQGDAYHGEHAAPGPHRAALSGRGPAGETPESPTLGFTHLQFEALLTAARDSADPCDFALVAMLGLLGLGIFEAIGADVTVRDQGLLPGWGRPMGRGTDPGSTQYLISYAFRSASAAWLS